MTLLRDALPRRAGLAVAIVCNVLGLVLLVVLVIYGLRYAERIGSQPIPALGFLVGDLFGADAKVPAMFWVYVALPIGLLLLAGRLAADMARYAAMFASTGYARDLRAQDIAQSPEDGA